MIIGIDEVGRGAWAGPVVVGAVSMGGVEIEGLTDSKLLSKKKREQLSIVIKQMAPRVGIGWVSARDIDRIGISAALKLAARRALAQISLADDDQIIIDGTMRLIDDPRVTLMKKADLLVPSVSAASIIAKVARDHYMYSCHELFPNYKWDGNVGYGAAAHRVGIDASGVTPLHRMSFEPMKSLATDSEASVRINSHVLKNAHGGDDAGKLPVESSENQEGRAKKDTTGVGKMAEMAASQYLEECGYTIIERNWKTKWCEIDILASKDDVVYFVEVKYRRRADQGGGIAAITPRKLNQMNFAARLWLHSNGEHNAQLSVIEVTGDDMSVTAFVDNAL